LSNAVSVVSQAQQRRRLLPQCSPVASNCMDDDELLAAVARISGSFETYALRQFKLTRQTPAEGGERHLLLTIMDAGPEAGRNRYMVEVRDEEPTGEESPPYSLSNPDDTIEHALSGVHWNEFDRSLPN
jgi:hypothetical protein